jgi:restriction endonuclease S subunit
MPKFVFYFLQSPIYWEQLQMNKIGGAQPNVNAKNLQNIKIPVPPIEQQQRIVTYLDDLKKQVSLLKKYQIETEEKFNLMVETVLKMAFSGKL